MRTINSKVEGFEGKCVPVWVNGNQVLNRLDGGTTGFFKLVEERDIFGVSCWFKVGEEFHGIIENGEVHTTEGRT